MQEAIGVSLFLFLSKNELKNLKKKKKKKEQTYWEGKRDQLGSYKRNSSDCNGTVLTFKQNKNLSDPANKK